MDGEVGVMSDTLKQPLFLQFHLHLFTFHLMLMKLVYSSFLLKTMVELLFKVMLYGWILFKLYLTSKEFILVLN